MLFESVMETVAFYRLRPSAVSTLPSTVAVVIGVGVGSARESVSGLGRPNLADEPRGAARRFRAVSISAP